MNFKNILVILLTIFLLSSCFWNKEETEELSDVTETPNEVNFPEENPDIIFPEEIASKTAQEIIKKEELFQEAKKKQAEDDSISFNSASEK